MEILNFFKGERGLRQGDTLSHLLFILVEEILSRMIKRAPEECNIEPFSHPRGAPLISHLLYADDIIIFTNGSRKSLRNIPDIFELYAQWPGQKLIVEKSSLHFSNYINLSQRRELLQETGLQKGSFPFRYFGVPVISSRMKIGDLDDLLCKICDRIGG